METFFPFYDETSRTDVQREHETREKVEKILGESVQNEFDFFEAIRGKVDIDDNFIEPLDDWQTISFDTL